MNTVRSAVGGYGLRPAAVGYRRAKRSELNVGFEELLLVLLAVVALFGIAYGFSCAVDLVQHWAVFERGAANLI